MPEHHRLVTAASGAPLVPPSTAASEMAPVGVSLLSICSALMCAFGCGIDPLSENSVTLETSGMQTSYRDCGGNCRQKASGLSIFGDLGRAATVSVKVAAVLAMFTLPLAVMAYRDPRTRSTRDS